MKKILLVLIASVIGLYLNAEEIKLSELFKAPYPKGAGVAVSPSHLHYAVAPGESKTLKVTINNDTEREYQFKVSLQDFNMDKNGKSAFVPAGQGEFSLSKNLSIAPSFVSMKAGEKKELSVNVSIPEDDPRANKAAWCIMMIEQVAEKKSLEKPKGKNIALGIVPTYAFGVYVYQNPPNVEIYGVEIVDFKTGLYNNSKKIIQLDAENKGDGIAYCSTYIELVNFSTGKSRKLPVKAFTIIPGLKREFKFVIPEDLEPGNYNAIGVVDYGSDQELLTAEMEFKL